ncbi:transposase [Bacillus tropicus]|uniref:transposase n=1 Tax=Bacillus cereus group TaxID=86661 RepID=UPI003D15FC8D
MTSLEVFVYKAYISFKKPIHFQHFLQYVLEEMPNKHIMMVLDNVRIHHAKLLKPFLRKNNGRLTLIFLSLYSSISKWIGTYFEMA